MIIDHTWPGYVVKRASVGKSRFNGAYYYSREIVKNIIPRVRTTRNWLTINNYGPCPNHSIVFIHNNKNPENYDWLIDQGVQDIILVCGVPETCKKVAHIGTAIYLPLSIDVEKVKSHTKPKTRETAYVGRLAKIANTGLERTTECVAGLPREQLLDEMAKYKKVYAVGRCAIEAKALGCEVLPFDPRFPDPSIWQVLDNADAAKILQKELDKIDGK